ncbi:MAG: L-seryl-tRNA selenium transferase [Acidobacteria bacterium]|nr:MAG: L-seryl-tRNA selenium transferase [Acidobacteriota bacterium]
MNFYQKLGLRRVINARSYSTKAGGSLMAPEVIQAMREAAESFVRMEDLQQAAGQIIARLTGAEAGYVTSGAAAGLTLGMAACIAGLDPLKMNRLPDARGMKNEVIIQRVHRNDYDHALRAAGAKVVEVGFNYATFPYEVERAINDKTAAIFFLAGSVEGSLSLEQIVQIAHSNHVPVIIDAAAELPPAENLRKFIAQGADLVAFSGGKHIGGPQASGILCGRRDLILSVALQHQDMDVFPETWPWRHLIVDGTLSGPPHHGVGRGLKVGKEEIAGLIAALELYATRDFEAELKAWHERIDTLIAGVEKISGLCAHRIFPLPSGQPVPSAHVQVDPNRAGLDAHALINALQEGEPIICTYENLASQGTIVFFPQCLGDNEPEEIVHKLKAIFKK